MDSINHNASLNERINSEIENLNDSVCTIYNKKRHSANLINSECSLATECSDIDIKSFNVNNSINDCVIIAKNINIKNKISLIEGKAYYNFDKNINTIESYIEPIIEHLRIEENFNS